mgnify:CR=1 FL=1
MKRLRYTAKERPVLPVLPYPVTPPELPGEWAAAADTVRRFGLLKGLRPTLALMALMALVALVVAVGGAVAMASATRKCSWLNCR